MRPDKEAEAARIAFARAMRRLLATDTTKLQIVAERDLPEFLTSLPQYPFLVALVRTWHDPVCLRCLGNAAALPETLNLRTHMGRALLADTVKALLRQLVVDSRDPLAKQPRLVETLMDLVRWVDARLEEADVAWPDPTAIPTLLSSPPGEEPTAVEEPLEGKMEDVDELHVKLDVSGTPPRYAQSPAIPKLDTDRPPHDDTSRDSENGLDIEKQLESPTTEKDTQRSRLSPSQPQQPPPKQRSVPSTPNSARPIGQTPQQQQQQGKNGAKLDVIAEETIQRKLPAITPSAALLSSLVSPVSPMKETHKRTNDIVEMLAQTQRVEGRATIIPEEEERSQSFDMDEDYAGSSGLGVGYSNTYSAASGVRGSGVGLEEARCVDNYEPVDTYEKAIEEERHDHENGINYYGDLLCSDGRCRPVNVPGFYASANSPFNLATSVLSTNFHTITSPRDKNARSHVREIVVGRCNSARASFLKPGEKVKLQTVNNNQSSWKGLSGNSSDTRNLGQRVHQPPTIPSTCHSQRTTSLLPMPIPQHYSVSQNTYPASAPYQRQRTSATQGNVYIQHSNPRVRYPVASRGNKTSVLVKTIEEKQGGEETVKNTGFPQRETVYGETKTIFPSYRSQITPQTNETILLRPKDLPPSKLSKLALLTTSTVMVNTSRIWNDNTNNTVNVLNPLPFSPNYNQTTHAGINYGEQERRNTTAATRLMAVAENDGRDEDKSEMVQSRWKKGRVNGSASIPLYKEINTNGEVEYKPSTAMEHEMVNKTFLVDPDTRRFPSSTFELPLPSHIRAETNLLVREIDEEVVGGVRRDELNSASLTVMGGQPYQKLNPTTMLHEAKTRLLTQPVWDENVKRKHDYVALNSRNKEGVPKSIREYMKAELDPRVTTELENANKKYTDYELGLDPDIEVGNDEMIKIVTGKNNKMEKVIEGMRGNTHNINQEESDTRIHLQDDVAPLFKQNGGATERILPSSTFKPPKKFEEDLVSEIMTNYIPSVTSATGRYKQIGLDAKASKGVDPPVSEVLSKMMTARHGVGGAGDVCDVDGEDGGGSDGVNAGDDKEEADVIKNVKSILAGFDTDPFGGLAQNKQPVRGDTQTPRKQKRIPDKIMQIAKMDKEARLLSKGEMLGLGIMNKEETLFTKEVDLAPQSPAGQNGDDEDDDEESGRRSSRMGFRGTANDIVEAVRASRDQEQQQTSWRIQREPNPIPSSPVPLQMSDELITQQTRARSRGAPTPRTYSMVAELEIGNPKPTSQRYNEVKEMVINAARSPGDRLNVTSQIASSSRRNMTLGVDLLGLRLGQPKIRSSSECARGGLLQICDDIFKLPEDKSLPACLTQWPRRVGDTFGKYAIDCGAATAPKKTKKKKKKQGKKKKKSR